MDNYLGEIRAFSCNFAPAGWALCNGALLQINSNQALYSLLGIQYGGDGKTTFALPDLMGRTPVGQSRVAPYVMGTKYGSETVTINTTQMPAHNHLFNAYSGAGTTSEPGNILAIPTPANTSVHINAYTTTATPLQTLNAGSITAEGNDAPHSNMQPFTVINFCIATQGNYPMRP